MFNTKEFVKCLDYIEKNKGIEARSQAMYLFVTGRMPEEILINLSKDNQQERIDQYLNSIETRMGKETCIKVMVQLQNGHLGMDMLAALAGTPTENPMVPIETVRTK